MVCRVWQYVLFLESFWALPKIKHSKNSNCQTSPGKWKGVLSGCGCLCWLLLCFLNSIEQHTFGGHFGYFEHSCETLHHNNYWYVIDSLGVYILFQVFLPKIKHVKIFILQTSSDKSKGALAGGSAVYLDDFCVSEYPGTGCCQAFWGKIRFYSCSTAAIIT